MKNLKIIKFWPILILAIVQAIHAANIVAVLEIVPADDEVELTMSQYRHLTDELRNRARAALPEEFSILTRDNMISLLPQDEKEMECLAEGCAVDIGRAIGADYVTQGQIRMFDGKLTLSVELFNSMSGNMLGSFVTEGENATSLLGTIREKSQEMFEKIPGAKKEEPVVAAEVAKPDTVVQVVYVSQDSAKPFTFKFGITARGGFAKTQVDPGKSKIAYSVGLVMVKDFGFIDFVPELLFSSEEFEIKEKLVSMLKVEVPLMARVVIEDVFGISLGVVAAVPLSAKIENVAVKDIEKFSFGAIGGLTYLFSEKILFNAHYEFYFTNNFTSVESSNTDKALCGISYLF